MSSLDLTTTRYALVDGVPVQEDCTFRYMPGDPRSRPHPGHDTFGMTVSVVDPDTGDLVVVPAPNEWFCISFAMPGGLPLFELPGDGVDAGNNTKVYPDTSTYWGPYDLPLRTGVTIITKEAYDLAVAAAEADWEAAQAEAAVNGLLAAQAAWDSKSALLTADGLGSASIEALLGPRPS